MTVALSRKDLSVLFDKEKAAVNGKTEVAGDAAADEEAGEDGAPAKKKTMPWQKNFKKGKKAADKKKASGGKKASAPASKPAKTTESAEKKEKSPEPKLKEEGSESGSEENSEDEDEDVGTQDEEAEKSAPNDAGDSSEPEKDDDQLVKLQSDVAMRRQRLLEGKSQISHSVHCPHFPEDKQEFWWVYISDRKQQMLLTAPYHVTNLVQHEEIQLKFTAPFKPGFYTFAVCLRSDSYLGFDQMKDIKVIPSVRNLCCFEMFFRHSLMFALIIHSDGC